MIDILDYLGGKTPTCLIGVIQMSLGLAWKFEKETIIKYMMQLFVGFGVEGWSVPMGVAIFPQN